MKFDKEKALKEDFRNQSSKDRVIKDLNKIEDIVLTYYNNKNIRKLKFFFKSFNQDACPPNDPGYPILNAYLRAACGKDLRDFDNKRLERVKKVEDRGYATDEEIIKFDTLITLYEEKIKEKMERQRKKQL